MQRVCQEDVDADGKEGGTEAKGRITEAQVCDADPAHVTTLLQSPGGNVPRPAGQYLLRGGALEWVEYE